MKKNIKVLVPIDFSSFSRETLEFALSLKECFDPSLCLLHVVVSGEVDAFANLGRETGAELLERVQRAEQALQEEAALHRCEEAPPIDCRVVTGTPFKEICRVAEEENFRLIVIGTHGRTGLAHLLIGSTAERVVQHAACPVVSIKPRLL